MNEKSNFGKIKYKDFIHTYTSGERIGYNTTLNTPYRFYTIEEIQNLEQQLATYKDKEDKIREYINIIDNWNYKKLEGRTNQINRNELLQILNEGSDKK